MFTRRNSQREANKQTDEAAAQSYGLTSAEAKRRLAEFGPNELEAAETDSFFKVAARQLFNFIFLLTSLSAIICFATGDKTKGTFLICLVFFIWVFNSIGEYSGQDAGAALRAMQPDKANVYRDGTLQEVAVPDIVIGDVLELKIGAVVPADVKVLECVELQTNESVLTGEPKEKAKIAVKDMSTDLSEANPDELPPCMLFKQTEVVAGRGICEVTATGMQTRVGLIAKRLKNPELTEASAEKAAVEINPLQKSVNKLGTIIGCACATVTIIASFSAYILEYQNLPQECAQHDKKCILFESIIRGLLMATAIIPHGLPLVCTVMLRVGSQLMAERNALVMRKSAVDYLGATQVICTDKTGTLTAGVMAAKLLIGAYREDKTMAPISQASFYPLKGLNPEGGIFVAEELTQAVEQQLDNGASPGDVGILNIGDKSSQFSGKNLPTALMTRASLTAAFVNCYACKISPPKSKGDKWTSEGSTTDAALKVAAWKGGMADDEPSGVDMHALYKNQEHLELPFSSSRKMSATVHQLPPGETNFAGIDLGSTKYTHVAILKGAPDRVLPSVTGLLQVKGGKLLLASGSMTKEEKAQIADQNDNLAKQALRSILMAMKPLTEKDVAALAAIKGQAEQRLNLLLAPGLTFMSLWGIFDPPRSSVPPSVQVCHEAGIRVVMITGDQQPTAVAIAKLVGILPQTSKAMLMARPCADLHNKALVSHDLIKSISGKDLKAPVHASEAEYKSVEDLADMTGQVCVWSRAQPTDKVAIVDSLDFQEYIASMTGDGVNDAPALKRADIGVAMGISGTAVTKNAADMVLMDDNFSTIVAAVAEGRKIYINVQKYVTFNLCVKASECLCCLVAIFSGLPMPIQGLPQLVNLVATHIIPPMALAWEDAEEYTMKVKPRTTKGDLVLDNVLVYFRWLPYVISYACVMVTSMIIYVWMETGYFSNRGLIATSSSLLKDQQQHACQVAGVVDGKGRFVADAVPFHCHCIVRNTYWDSAPKHLDEWGRFDSDDSRLAPELGDFDMMHTPWNNAYDKFLEPCAGSDGNVNLCWQNPKAAKPLLGATSTCSSSGARVATTMSYLSIALTEITTLVTFRTDGPFWRARRNDVYLCLLGFNLCVLTTVLSVPAIRDALGFVPLKFHQVLLASIPMVLMMTIVELIIKPEFRFQLQKKHELETTSGEEDSPGSRLLATAQDDKASIV